VVVVENDEKATLLQDRVALTMALEKKISNIQILHISFRFSGNNAAEYVPWLVLYKMVKFVNGVCKHQQTIENKI
jgi:hypothetical protein